MTHMRDFMGVLMKWSVYEQVQLSILSLFLLRYLVVCYIVNAWNRLNHVDQQCELSAIVHWHYEVSNHYINDSIACSDWAHQSLKNKALKN